MKKIIPWFFLIQCSAICIFDVNFSYSAGQEFGDSYINGSYQRNLFREVPFNNDAYIEPPYNRRDSRQTSKRYVKVNFDYLKEANSVVLNLFQDISFIAVKDSIYRRSERQYSWFGHIDDKGQNATILVIDNGEMVGNITIDGKFYQIRPLSGGVHMVREIEQSAFPSEAPYISADDAEPPRDLEPPSPQYDDSPFIDVMVVYTDDAARVSPNINAEIQLAIDETNASFANSDIQTRVRLVHSVELNYSETADLAADLYCITWKTDGCLDSVHQLRDIHGADLVSFWVDDGGPYCGIAWLMTEATAAFESLGFSVVDRDCATGNYTFGHELGHNMGAQHDRYVASQNGVYEYSFGYVYKPDRWRTIMAYSTDCFDSGFYCSRIPYWSNPNITINGVPTGIMSEHPDSADNSKTINGILPTVSNFRPSSFSEPIPDIELNGSDGPLYIAQGATLLIEVSLDAGNYSGASADWWVLAVTPTGEWYYFDYPFSRWRYAGSLDNISTSYQGALNDLAALDIYDLDTSNLSAGNYIFYFAVDTNANGSIDYDRVRYDSAVVTLIPIIE